MHLTIVAKPKKKQTKVVRISPDTYAVSVTAPPVAGQANDAIIQALAKYFSISPSQIILLSGHTSKIKTLAVPDSLTDFEILPQQKTLF